MDDTKITRQRDRRIGPLKVSTKITRPGDGRQKITLQNDRQMESYMVGTKKNSPKDGELNGRHAPKEWTT